jgi:hypothetical protein
MSMHDYYWIYTEKLIRGPRDTDDIQQFRGRILGQTSMNPMASEGLGG